MPGADAVLLLAFGGPTRPEEIRPFIAAVTQGRPIPPERLEEVAHHYELIGGRSPLNALTFKQAEGLRRALGRVPVYVGMRVWEPLIAGTLAQMTLDGVRSALALILAPHATEASRERYVTAVDAGRAQLGARAPAIRYAPSWHVHPGFVAAWVDRIRTALATLPAEHRDDAVVVITAHSIPSAAAATSPYEREIAATAEAVAGAAGRARWQIAYQSRSGNPRDPWLEPDVNDAFRTLAAAGTRAVVAAPIGFVCDHVEVLYDIDVEARATAAKLGLAFARAETPNDHPQFIEMLADVVRGQLR